MTSIALRRAAAPLRVYRVAQRLSQAELASLAGVRRETVQGLETQQDRRPHPLTAQALAEALHVDVADLFPENDERAPTQASAVPTSADAGGGNESGP